MGNALIDLIMRSQQPEHQGMRNALRDHMMSQNVVYEEPTQRRWTPPWQTVRPTRGGSDPLGANHRGNREEPTITSDYKRDLGSQQGVNYGAMSNSLLPGSPFDEIGFSFGGISGNRPQGQMTQEDWRKVLSDWYQSRVRGMR